MIGMKAIIRQTIQAIAMENIAFQYDRKVLLFAIYRNLLIGSHVKTPVLPWQRHQSVLSYQSI